jgi:hypothetical protein
MNPLVTFVTFVDPALSFDANSVTYNVTDINRLVWDGNVRGDLRRFRYWAGLTVIKPGLGLLFTIK